MKVYKLYFSVFFIFAAILFDDAILLGAENDTTLYSSDSNLVFSLPFCVINRTVGKKQRSCIFRY